MITWEEYFKDVMNKIKVGSIIKYTTHFRHDDIRHNDTRLKNHYKISQVIRIKNCNNKKNQVHEGCNFCVGYIHLNNGYEFACFKERGTWNTRIVSVDNSLIDDFITEDEFKV